MARTVRIAMLNADIPVPVVKEKYPTYGAIFHHLLSAAAARIAPSYTITSQDFDIVQGEYPEDITTFDALLITGSASSSYDDIAWGKRLDAYVQQVYHQHPGVKMFGSCYGHQMICQSLLKPYGVKVGKDPNGWEIGVHEVAIDDEFREVFGNLGLLEDASPHGRAPPTPEPEDDQSTPLGLLAKPTPEKLMLQFVHADSVQIPPSGLPTGWFNIGKSAQCAAQGVYQPGRVLTYQGHFEFDRFVNSETIKAFGAKWDPVLVSGYLAAIDADDDSLEAAELVVRFLLEGSARQSGTSGLITPPL
ncbi:hypothetical protein NM208_g4034 [Fusarium decemcellulare]|uniref:Uncharacterized protein n=2 Tax=Fusarium decemcellulare TaxID=57161 RepID=A0ACC1SMH2_9HYPO|nr:hypothetical protein NM208_g4277 [Fusarium decemcellulare]KAJ3542553.1 hypothetical protein NM208_g4034 [Fusarium decemcellulare]